MGPWWLAVGKLQEDMRCLREKGAALEAGPLTATGASARARAAVLEATGALARIEPTSGDQYVGAAWTAVARARAALDEAAALTLPERRQRIRS